AELLVRRMPEVRLQPADVVELDDRHVIGDVGRHALVAGAVDEAAADADAADGRNLTDRALERIDERGAVARREIGPRLHQHQVRQHRLLVRRFVVAPLPRRAAAVAAGGPFAACRLAARRFDAPRLLVSAARRFAARLRPGFPRPIAPRGPAWLRVRPRAVAARRAGLPVRPRFVAARRAVGARGLLASLIVTRRLGAPRPVITIATARLSIPGPVAARTIRGRLVAPRSIGARTIGWRLVAPRPIAARTIGWRLVAPRSIAARAIGWRLVAPRSIGARTIGWRLVAPGSIAARAIGGRLVAPGSIAARAIGWRLVAPRSIAPRSN